MRTKNEVLGELLRYAYGEKGVRSVVLTGSRANPHLFPDALQDYDVVFVVRAIPPFLEDTGWLAQFGPPAILQRPDDNALFPEEASTTGRYAFLMQFWDGVRIDLSLVEEPHAKEWVAKEAHAKILLDKDNFWQGATPANAHRFDTHLPTAAAFAACCNEFWWVAPYVAKGLCRGQLLYAADHLNNHVRPMLLRLLGWQAVSEAGTPLPLGKNLDGLRAHLPTATWEALLQTYAPAQTAPLWDALGATTALFAHTAPPLAAQLGFAYNTEEQRGSLHTMQWMRELAEYTGL